MCLCFGIVSQRVLSTSNGKSSVNLISVPTEMVISSLGRVSIQPLIANRILLIIICDCKVGFIVGEKFIGLQLLKNVGIFRSILHSFQFYD